MGSLDWPAFPHEALAVVLSVRGGRLSVLMWQRASPRMPADGRCRAAPSPARTLARVAATPPGREGRAPGHRLSRAAGDAQRDEAGPARPRARDGLSRHRGDNVEPQLPPDTAWVPVDQLPATAFDHHDFVTAGVDRLRAKLSYTNIGFALAPPEFSLSELRDVISAALGYSVHPTNLARVMTRRQLIEPTGDVSLPGPGGGRPGAIYRFSSRELLVTDPFAVLRPPRHEH